MLPSRTFILWGIGIAPCTQSYPPTFKEPLTCPFEIGKAVLFMVYFLRFDSRFNIQIWCRSCTRNIFSIFFVFIFFSHRYQVFLAFIHINPSTTFIPLICFSHPSVLIFPEWTIQIVYLHNRRSKFRDTKCPLSSDSFAVVFLQFHPENWVNQSYGGDIA